MILCDFRKAFTYCWLKDIRHKSTVQKARKSSLLEGRCMNSDCHVKKQVCSSCHAESRAECAMCLARQITLSVVNKVTTLSLTLQKCLYPPLLSYRHLCCITTALRLKEARPGLLLAAQGRSSTTSFSLTSHLFGDPCTWTLHPAHMLASLQPGFLLVGRTWRSLASLWPGITAGTPVPEMGPFLV